jgi:glycosyltransferase involved in cell wall biosynthesis
MKQWFEGNKANPALAITLYDVWVYTAKEWEEFPVASWTPVDHKILPHGVKSWFDRKGEGKWAIAMSKFGEQELLEGGVSRDNLFYAPHSYDPDIYKPYDLALRKELNVPEDAHLTIVASANKGNSPVRKSWSELLTAWTEWAKGKDDAYLYLHTDAMGIASGVNLVALLTALGAPESQVRIVPQLPYRMNIPAETVAKLYAAADVLLMPSRGEGFGVPLIEAQACGTPVITTDWTAMTELCGSGWLVEGQVEYDHHQGGWWKVPFISSIKDALQASYEQSKNEKAEQEGKDKAVAFAKDYATPVVYDTHWRPSLRELEGRLPIKS